MPWLLTTALPVDSAISADGDLTHCRLHLRDNNPDRKRIMMTISYGRMPASDFVPAAFHPPTQPSSHEISDADWDTITTDTVSDVKLSDPSNAARYIEVDVGGTPVWVERTYYTNKRGLYEALVAASIIPAGSLV